MCVCVYSLAGGDNSVAVGKGEGVVPMRVNLRGGGTARKAAIGSRR